MISVKTVCTLCRPVFVVLLAMAVYCSPSLAYADGDPYAELVTFEVGSTSAVPAAIENEIRAGGQSVYKEVETKLLSLLAKPEATYACKKIICDDLRIVGSEASVKPLLPLLADEKTSDLARLALESIPGKAVDSALLTTLKTSSGKVQIGIIQTLATRHNANLADVFEDYLASGSEDLIRASLQALARVGGKDALNVVKAAKVKGEFQSLRERALIDAAYNVVADGGKNKALAAFEQQYKAGTDLPAVVGAFNGLIDYGSNPVVLLAGALNDKRVPLALAGAKAATRMNDDGVLKVLVDAFSNVQPAVQVAIVRTLAERGDKAGLPVVKKALASADKLVLAEAVSACEKLGDSSVLSDLVAMAVCNFPEAQQAISRLAGADVNGLLQKLLDDADDAKVRVGVIALKARDDRSVMPRLLKLAESEKAELRSLAVATLDGFAEEGEVQALIALLVKNQSQSEQEKIAMALWKAARAIENEDARFARLWNDVGGGQESIKGLILPLASAASGSEALNVVTGVLASGSDVMKDRAARTLFKWQSDLAVKALINLIKGTGEAKYKILGMQAVVRILTDKRCHWVKEKKVATLNEILPLMDRPEDKQAIEDAVKRINDGNVKK